MLEDEKARLRRQLNEKKNLNEQKLRFENEERLKSMTDAMKQEFGHSQRVLDNRHYE